MNENENFKLEEKKAFVFRGDSTVKDINANNWITTDSESELVISVGDDWVVTARRDGDEIVDRHYFVGVGRGSNYRNVLFSLCCTKVGKGPRFDLLSGYLKKEENRG